MNTPKGRGKSGHVQPRVTIPVHPEFLELHDMLKRDTGISMTYGQVVNYLIHFYKTHPRAIPTTQWVGSSRTT